MTHTPGPWLWLEVIGGIEGVTVPCQGVIVQSGAFRAVARVVRSLGMADGEFEGNQRLISAAPDLLIALDMVATKNVDRGARPNKEGGYVDNGRCWCLSGAPGVCRGEPQCFVARAAIRKAEKKGVM